MSMFASVFVPMIVLGAAASPVGSVGIVLPEPASGIVERIAAIASRQIAARSDVQVVRSGETDFVLTLAVDPALPREGFEIADASDGGIRIAGWDAHSILYGLGKFLRTSRYDGGFTPSTWRGQSSPEGAFRAVYAATHFNNFYEAAPPDEVAAYIEDLALWGANAVIVHFPTWSFAGYDDPAARRNIEQTRRLLQAAKAIGMKTGLIQCPNQGFTSAPDNVRAEPNRDPQRRRGDAGVNCCPSKPEGMAYLLDLYARLFDEYKDIGLDYFMSWPYDEGGCGCAACAPWGGNAFPALSKKVAALGRAVYPDINVILSTWVYDVPPEGEWEGLTAYLNEDHTWLDAILSDDHFDFPRYPLDHGVPARLPLYNFPEISMWGRSPWGGCGANPLPARYEALWKQTDGKLSGGMPYSEGIFEDMNKVVCFQFYWNKNTAAEDTLREYAAFEFSPEAVEDVIEAVRLLEAAWIERGPKSVEAFQLLEKVDAALPSRAKAAWRWRLLYLRGLIDAELARNGNKMEGDILRNAFRELTAIYHAENAHPAVKPHAVP
ncbi:MAG: hypothetical protein QG656_2467 [Candidatus Hydrogenedentes bacterium]|nr:hypothetical protein [Candidatus Hydrogenedentota bacterium]